VHWCISFSFTKSTLSRLMTKAGGSILTLMLCLGFPPVSALAQFTPTETIVGDPASGCLGMEFSPDMKWFVWTQQGAIKASWLCGMNPDTGDLVPANGKPLGQNGQPFSIPNRAIRSWGGTARVGSSSPLLTMGVSCKSGLARSARTAIGS
jgi:hypothetical protein